jgi:hypothetical protein
MAKVTARPLSELPGLLPPGAPPKKADSARALRDGTDDLALNKSGAATWAKRDEAIARSPVRNRLFEVMRLLTLERNWRIGALGEEEVAYELSRLGAEWRQLHSVPIGKGETIDHVLICPAGVFAIGTTHRPRSTATVTEQGIRINGARTDHATRIRSQAARATRVLGEAYGSPVEVGAVVVFVGLRDLTIDAQPAGVHVTTSRRIGGRRTVGSSRSSRQPARGTRVLPIGRGSPSGRVTASQLRRLTSRGATLRSTMTLGVVERRNGFACAGRMDAATPPSAPH